MAETEWPMMAAEPFIKLSNIRTTTLQPFNGLWSGSTWVGQYQKKQLLCIFLEQGMIMEAEALTVRVSATRTGLTAPSPPQPPKVFYRPDALPAAQPTASKH